jgi:rare lipoprotein A
MLMRKRILQFGAVTLFMLLGACGTVSNNDSAPKRAPDVSHVPNAVPKAEPLSRYGNPAQYEVFGKRYYTMKTGQGYHERGVASWYGTKFHGKRTSSGEPYDMYAMTAAHKTLPLPTYVEVTNVNNGRKVIVKVNDRGPFHGNRIIDLSYSAAKKLDIISKGTGLVEVRAITPGYVPTNINTTTTAPIQAVSLPVSNTPQPLITGLYLQVGAFGSLARAEQVKLQVQKQLGDAALIVPLVRPQGSLYRVRIGPLANVEYGDSLSNRLVDMGFNDAHIVVE